MNKNITIILLVSSCQIFAQTGNAETIYMAVSGKSGKSCQKMHISFQKGNTAVDYHDSNGESTSNVYSPMMDLLESIYYDAQKNPYMKLDFNAEQGKIISTGLVNKIYEKQNPVYDGNGSLFHVFSRILPEENKILEFNLLQSKDKRIVKMYLKIIAHEVINVDGRMVESLKYETGLTSRLISLFWPYKYHYWFASKDHRFLRYAGPVGHVDEELIVVKKCN